METVNTQPEHAPLEEVIRVGDHFYVLALSSRADDRTRVLKHNDTFGVLDRYGDILASGMGDQGLFHNGTRHLSRLEFTIDRTRPLLLGSGLDQENIVLGIDLTNPDLSDKGKIVVPRGTLHVFRSVVLWDRVMHHCLTMHNFGTVAVRLAIAIRFDADFADIFEVRGVRRARRGRIHPPRLEKTEVILEYSGLDGLSRWTRIACDGATPRLGSDRMEITVELEPAQERSIAIRVNCESATEHEPPPITCAVAIDHARTRAAAMRQRSCDVSTSSEPFNDWLVRSRADLQLMIAHTPEGPYPHAGMPWFSAPFGRDGIITALETLWVEPDFARGVLKFLAAMQADAHDPANDAEPGKILHEMRQGEMAATGEVPYARYYGSVDSTPLFVMLAGEFLHATGDVAFIKELWPNIRRALEWIDTHGDLDRDGFVEYAAKTPQGLTNQGWKDSHDSVMHENGALANAPIALCEVQGYVYAAKRAASEIASKLGDSVGSAALLAQADALRERFNQRFWDEGLGMFVLALDGDKRPCRVAASNVGHCLYTGIASPEQGKRIVAELLSPRFFTGWGVRTLATRQARYNPMSYHNGSVWPHDTALAAAGFARYGQAAAASRLLSAMLDVSIEADLHRIPELFCGFERRQGEGPVRYPVACSPQSWASGAVFMMMQACLGLAIDAARREVVFRNPTLPEALDVVHLRGLHVGTATTDLVLQRQSEGVGVTVVRRAPAVRVIVTE